MFHWFVGHSKVAELLLHQRHSQQLAEIRRRLATRRWGKCLPRVALSDRPSAIECQWLNIYEDESFLSGQFRFQGRRVLDQRLDKDPLLNSRESFATNEHGRFE